MQARDPARKSGAIVGEKLKQQQWSPQQIAGWLKATYPDDPEMQVSHETIYRTLFIQSRGALRRELTAHLRTGRVILRPAGTRLPDGRGGRPGILNISERPAEADDRAVPGHWEGDLVFGKRMSPVATLVERSTRFVMLVALPNGHKADLVADALAAKITTLPAALTRTLTWDQGHEMALHVRFTEETGIEVYFCDPKSPWQRGSNENTKQDRFKEMYIKRFVEAGDPRVEVEHRGAGLDLGDRVGLDRGHVAGLHLLGEDRAAGGVDAFADDRERVLVADVDLATGTGQRGDRHRAHTATPTSFFAISTASGALFA